MSSIVTLTINPAVDLYTTVEGVVAIHKLRCKGLMRQPGGGGINVARAAQRLGGAVHAVYTAGGPIGQLLQRLIAQEEIDGTPVAIVDDTRESFTVTETRSGQQYRFVLPGPSLTEGEWQRCLDVLSEAAASAGFVVASGSLPPGVPDDFYARVARAAKKVGARCVLDTSGKALAAALEEGVYLVKPNLREMRQLTGRPLDDQTSRLAAASELAARGGAEVVALTLGQEGALLATADLALAAVPPPVEIVSPVGAGDSFVAGMVQRLAAGSDLEAAFRCGVAAGTAALFTPGTELCRRQDVERLYEEVRVTRAGN